MGVNAADPRVNTSIMMRKTILHLNISIVAILIFSGCAAIKKSHVQVTSANDKKIIEAVDSIVDRTMAKDVEILSAINRDTKTDIILFDIPITTDSIYTQQIRAVVRHETHSHYDIGEKASQRTAEQIQLSNNSIERQTSITKMDTVDSVKPAQGALLLRGGIGLALIGVVILILYFFKKRFL